MTEKVVVTGSAIRRSYGAAARDPHNSDATTAALILHPAKETFGVLSTPVLKEGVNVEIFIEG